MDKIHTWKDECGDSNQMQQGNVYTVTLPTYASSLTFYVKLILLQDMTQILSCWWVQDQTHD